MNNVTTNEEIVAAFGNMVYKLAFCRVNNKELAADIFQEVFLKVVTKKKHFESDEHLKAWLIRVTINCSNDYLKSPWFKRTESLSEQSEKASDTSFLQHDIRYDVYSAVTKLAPKYRTVIHLFYYEDFSVKQISEQLEINESTVRSTLKRGREKLKKTLGGKYDYE